MPLPLTYVTPNEIRREWMTQLSTQEVGILGNLCSYVSRGIDAYTGRHFYTTTGDETKDFDGPRENETRSFAPGLDIVAVTTLQLAVDTVSAASGTFASIDAADYYLRPGNPPDGQPYWPFERIFLTDDPTGTYNSSAPYTYFEPGLDTIRILGRFGWNTTTVNSSNFPQPIRAVAAEVVTKLYRMRDAGFSNTFGVSEIGTAVIERVLSPWAREILDSYRKPAVI